MSTHEIYERGHGFPEVGERVYSSEDNAVYTVESIDSSILTRQFQANRIEVTLSYDCDPTDLSDEEFAELRELRVVALKGEGGSEIEYRIELVEGEAHSAYAIAESVGGICTYTNSVRGVHDLAFIRVPAEQREAVEQLMDENECVLVYAERQP